MLVEKQDALRIKRTKIRFFLNFSKKAWQFYGVRACLEAEFGFYGVNGIKFFPCEELNLACEGRFVV